MVLLCSSAGRPAIDAPTGWLHLFNKDTLRSFQPCMRMPFLGGPLTLAINAPLYSAELAIHSGADGGEHAGPNS
eukprot:2631288-Pyramimonas_sp.AAC.1